MAVIRQKKRNLVLAMICGIVISAVPLGIYGGVITYKRQQAVKQLEDWKRKAEKEKTYTAYCLKEPKNKGDFIRAEDLQEISVRTKETFYTPKREDLEGKYLTVGVNAGIIITDALVYEQTGPADDVRTYFYDYLVMPDGISAQDRFDIRIRFPNGEDYVIAKEKMLESQTETGVFINTSEKEHLLLCSAYVDTKIYEGSVIYAALYVADYQRASIPNYPFNLYTTDLAEWDPNLIEEVATEENRTNRQILEGNLFHFMGVAMGGGNKTDNSFDN